MKKYITPECLCEIFQTENVILASNMNQSGILNNNDVIMEDIDWGDNW